LERFEASEAAAETLARRLLDYLADRR
jgi:hypothetical protein